MDDAGPSLARRAVAALVLVVVAIILVRALVGFISAVFWLVAIAVLVVAAIWAYTTLKSGQRSRDERPRKRDRDTPAAPASIAAPEDRVEAQMEQIKRQMRDQGRL